MVTRMQRCLGLLSRPLPVHRFHGDFRRHQRSMSVNNIPFPPALINTSIVTNVTNVDMSRRCSSPLAASSSNTDLGEEDCRVSNTVVGSLEVLDLRGTFVLPKNFVKCLSSITSHHDNDRNENNHSSTRRWCRVRFKTLSLNGCYNRCHDNGTADDDNQQQCLWSNGQLRHLEEILAMDNGFERRILQKRKKFSDLDTSVSVSSDKAAVTNDEEIIYTSSSKI